MIIMMPVMILRERPGRTRRRRRRRRRKVYSRLTQ